MNAIADGGHEGVHEVDVVSGNEDGPQHLLVFEKVVKVASAGCLARQTRALLLNRLWIAGKDTVLEVNVFAAYAFLVEPLTQGGFDEGAAMAGDACGVDAVERIDPYRDAMEDVLDPTNAEEMRRTVAPELSHGEGDNISHLLLCGAQRSTHSLPPEGFLVDEGAALPPEVFIDAPLDDAVEGLGKGLFFGGFELFKAPEAPLFPAMASAHRGFGVGALNVKGSALIKCQDDVSADRFLDLDRLFWRESLVGPIPGGFKPGSLFCEGDTRLSGGKVSVAFDLLSDGAVSHAEDLIAA